VDVKVQVDVGVKVGVLVKQETMSVTELVRSDWRGEPISMEACSTKVGGTQELILAQKVTVADVPFGTKPIFQTTMPDTREQGAPEQET
jgi:hypothetical protein